MNNIRDGVPDFVFDTCHFCGGDEADKTMDYVRALQVGLADSIRVLEIIGDWDNHGEPVSKHWTEYQNEDWVGFLVRLKSALAPQ